MKTINSLPLCYRLSFDSQSMTLFWKLQKWTLPFIYKRYLTKKTLVTKWLDPLSIKFTEKAGWSLHSKSLISLSAENDDEIIYSLAIPEAGELSKEDCKAEIKLAIKILDHLIDFSNGELIRWSTDGLRKIWPKPSKKQLVAVASMEAGMLAWTDDTVFDWTKAASQEQVAEIISAMQATHIRLGLGDFNSLSFRFRLYGNNSFGFSVPGIPDWAELGTSSSIRLSSFGDIGQTLYSDHVDTVFQKLELLIGLAKLNDLVENK